MPGLSLFFKLNEKETKAMKYIVIMLLFSISGAIETNAQELRGTQIPQQILTSFSQDFSNARDVEWEVPDSSFYEVEFETRWGRDHEARYDSEGSLLYHKEEIRNRNVPEAIKTLIDAEYDGYKIDDAERIKEGNETRYLLSLDSRNMQDIDLLVHENGEVISQVFDD